MSLEPRRFRVRLLRIFAVLLVGVTVGCASMPDPKVERHDFPQNIFVEKPDRKYKVMGEVKSRVDYTSLDPQHEEKFLCKNYYNKAAKLLLKYAKDKGADAVTGVRSIVFLEDGRVESYKTPECSDDGAEGQILLHGIAVKWLKEGEVPTPAAAPASSPTPSVESTPEPKPTEPVVRHDLEAPQPTTEWE